MTPACTTSTWPGTCSTRRSSPSGCSIRARTAWPSEQLTDPVLFLFEMANGALVDVEAVDQHPVRLRHPRRGGRRDAARSSSPRPTRSSSSAGGRYAVGYPRTGGSASSAPTTPSSRNGSTRSPSRQVDRPSSWDGYAATVVCDAGAEAARPASASRCRCASSPTCTASDGGRHRHRLGGGFTMVKIALDPAMYHADLSVADEVRKAAELGYEYLELSPAGRLVLLAPLSEGRRRRRIAEVKKACTGNRGEDLRHWCRCSTGHRRTSRNGRPRCATGSGCWRSPTELECPHRQLRALRRPERPGALRARVLPLDGGADPDLRAVRDRAEPGGAPVRLRRAQRRRRADHPRPEPAVGELRVLRSARLPPLRRGGRHPADDGVRRRPSCSTCTSPTASTTGPTSATATSSTRPGWMPASTSTTRSATATSTGTSSSPPCAT